jgi:hypothetical protein
MPRKVRIPADRRNRPGGGTDQGAKTDFSDPWDSDAPRGFGRMRSFSLKKSAKIAFEEIRVAAILVNARLHFRGRK